LNLRANNHHMRTGDPVVDSLHESAQVPRASRRALELTGGGTDGNEQLTAITGVILLVVLAVLGVTILRIRQLISVHLFVGLLLIGPVALKMASTGYRFARYYTRDTAYRRKGPPELVLRLMAPVVVLSTVVVFVSGIVLLFDGPASRGQWLSIHKVSFFVWVAFTALHVLGHLPSLGRSLRAEAKGGGAIGAVAGRGGRSIALAGALVGGIVLALVLIPQFAAWSGHAAFLHHH
jgi:hypothetical protein